MDKKRLLILHNGTNRDFATGISQPFADAGMELDIHWAYNNEFPESLDGYAGAFITGSPHGAYEDVPFIHKEHKVVQALVDQEIPTLGVCFGSQILASALCGRDQVFRRDSCEVGFKWVALNEKAADDPLTTHIDESVYMFIWHNDEIQATHPDMTILASTDACPNQIWRYRNLPVWGIQGHPEIAKAHAEVWFTKDRAAFEKDGADVDQMRAEATDTLEAKTLLTKFAEICLEEAGLGD